MLSKCSTTKLHPQTSSPNKLFLVSDFFYCFHKRLFSRSHSCQQVPALPSCNVTLLEERRSEKWMKSHSREMTVPKYTSTSKHTSSKLCTGVGGRVRCMGKSWLAHRCLWSGKYSVDLILWRLLDPEIRKDTGVVNDQIHSALLPVIRKSSSPLASLTCFRDTEWKVSFSQTPNCPLRHWVSGRQKPS